MKNLIYKKLNIVEIILCLSPIIDILTSISKRTLNTDISLGLIIRSFLLLFLVVFTIFKSNSKYKKLSIIYFVSIAIYVSLFIYNIFINKGSTYIISETKELMKAFYFPICMVCILNYNDTKNETISLKVLFIVIMEYILLLFIPSIFNLGYESYAEDKVGTIGWFFSANEISSIYSILTVIVIFSYKYIKNIAIYFGVIVLTMYTVMQIGTKMPAVSLLISIMAFIFISIIRLISTKNKEYIKSLVIGSITFVIFCVTFVFSPVLKNFDIYRNYLISSRDNNETVQTTATQTVEENQVDDIELQQNESNTEVIKEVENTEKTHQEELGEPQNRELTGDEIATIIHSGRAETKNKIEDKFYNSSLLIKLIGLGRYDLENADEYLIETDYFDILFNFGIIGFIIYFIPVIIIAGNIISKLYKSKFKTIFKDDYNYCYTIIIFNGLLCAIAGHTFVAPAVSIYISIIFIQLFENYKLEK